MQRTDSEKTQLRREPGILNHRRSFIVQDLHRVHLYRSPSRNDAC
jgi:hypothetical protein